MNRLRTIGLLILVLTTLQFISVLAQTEDSATGTVVVGSAVPTVATVQIVNTTFDVVTSLTPDNTLIFGVNATIGDANSLADLKNVSFYLYDNSTHFTDFNSASPDGLLLFHMWWNESNDLWTLEQGSLTEWSNQSAVDPGSASGLTSFVFTARFDISRAARADTDWKATVIAYDESEVSSPYVNSSLFTMEEFLEISWSSSTFTWGTVTITSVNNTMVANRTITIRSNTQWELRVNGSDFTAVGEPDVDIDGNNTVVLDVDGVEGGTDNMYIRNSFTVGPTTWDNQAALSTETPVNRDANFWFTDSGFHTGGILYSITIFIELRANT